jgi:uncharacterized protein (DUF305 family)
MRKILIAILMILGLSGCSAISDAGHDAMGHDAMGNGKYDAAAVMFAQMMIPHHEQAVALSNIALEISDNPEVRDLATRIKSAQAPEIDQMKTWIDSVGLPDMNHMMDMPGFVDDAQFAAIKELAGNSFDLLFLELMIAHHQGAIEMVSDIANNKTAEVKALGEEIVASQTAEIAEMQALLGALS